MNAWYQGDPVQFSRNVEPEVFFTNWDNAFDYTKSWWSANISEAGLKHIAKTLDPNGNIFLLFSIYENPNFEYLEQLENIARRYHLGKKSHILGMATPIGD
jgi:hypothetical protein